MLQKIEVKRSHDTKHRKSQLCEEDVALVSILVIEEEEAFDVDELKVLWVERELREDEEEGDDEQSHPLVGS